MELNKKELLEGMWCDAFYTITEASNDYPSNACKNCPHNQFNYEEGIATCERILAELSES